MSVIYHFNKKFILLFLLTFSITSHSQDISLLCDGKEITLLNSKKLEKNTQKSFVLSGHKLIEDKHVLECEVNTTNIKCFKEHPTSKTSWNVDIDRISGKIEMFSSNSNSTFINEFFGTCKNVKKIF